MVKAPCSGWFRYILVTTVADTSHLVMSLALITRVSTRQTIARTRSLHTTSPVRDAHGHYHVCFIFSLRQ